MLNMKKLFLVLGMVTCMLAMCACGNEAADVSAFYVTEDEATEWGTSIVESLNSIVISGAMADYSAYEAEYAALESWSLAIEDMGDYQGVIGVSSSVSDDEAIIVVEIEGSQRNAEVEIIIDESYAMTSASTNVTYSFGEQMGKAGLNTLMGMGTVFTVLILISLVIGCFGYIPKMLEQFTKKDAVEVKEAPVVAAAIEEVEEELVDDLELIAVIAAAIAASEGAASAEGYQVRSIRRARRA